MAIVATAVIVVIVANVVAGMVLVVASEVVAVKLATTVAVADTWLGKINSSCSMWALLTQTSDCNQSRSMKCYNCGEQGHYSKDCPVPQQERICYNCEWYMYASGNIANVKKASNQVTCHQHAPLPHRMLQVSRWRVRKTPTSKVTFQVGRSRYHRSRTCLHYIIQFDNTIVAILARGECFRELYTNLQNYLFDVKIRGKAGSSHVLWWNLRTRTTCEIVYTKCLGRISWLRKGTDMRRFQKSCASLKPAWKERVIILSDMSSDEEVRIDSIQPILVLWWPFHAFVSRSELTKICSAVLSCRCKTSCLIVSFWLMTALDLPRSLAQYWHRYPLHLNVQHGHLAFDKSSLACLADLQVLSLTSSPVWSWTCS